MDTRRQIASATAFIAVLLAFALAALASVQCRASAGVVARSHRDDVFVVDVASRSRRNLTRTAQRDAAVSWSPDGRSIAYTTLVDASASNRNLWRAYIRLGRVRPATLELSGGTFPQWAGGDWSQHADRSWIASRSPVAVWSPDGTKLAYSTFAQTSWPWGGYLALVVWDVHDGSQVVTGRLVDTSATPREISDVADPHWAPDGSLLVFLRTVEHSSWVEGGALPAWAVNLYAVRPDGTGERQLTFQSPWATPNQQVFFESWLPDGRLVARLLTHTLGVGGPSGEECFAVGTAEPRPWNKADRVSCGLRSPDGQRIARFVGDDGLYVDGRRIVSGAVGLVTWASDSRRIAYVRDWRLWVVDAVTGRPRALTTDTKRQEVFTSLSWSPDGRKIAFTSFLARP